MLCFPARAETTTLEPTFTAEESGTEPDVDYVETTVQPKQPEPTTTSRKTTTSKPTTTTRRASSKSKQAKTCTYLIIFLFLSLAS